MTDLIHGKWYKVKLRGDTNITYIKMDCVVVNTNTLRATDWIYLKRHFTNGTWDYSKLEHYEKLKTLDEIQEFLPQGHEDKIDKTKTETKSVSEQKINPYTDFVFEPGGYYVGNWGDGDVIIRTTTNSLKDRCYLIDVLKNYRSPLVGCRTDNNPTFRKATEEEKLRLIKEMKVNGDWIELFSEQNPQEIVVFGKYKIGQIVVSLTTNDYRKKGDLLKILPDSRSNAIFFTSDTCSSDQESWRAATNEEIRAYNNGVTNIKDIKTEVQKPKDLNLIGRHVKALVNAPNSGLVKAREIGIITSKGVIDFPSQKYYYFFSEYDSLKQGLKSEKYELMPVDYNPEIVNPVSELGSPQISDPETVAKQELLAEAHRRYPPGTVYLCPAGVGRHNPYKSGFNLVEENTKFQFFCRGENIDAIGKGYVYYRGKWAEIISTETKEEKKTEILSSEPQPQSNVLDKDSLLKEAHRRYPIGTKVRCLSNGQIETITSGFIWLGESQIIQGALPQTRVYRTDMWDNPGWAEVVETTKENLELKSEVKTIEKEFKNGNLSASQYVEDTEKVYNSKKQTLEEEYNSNVFNQEFKLVKPYTKSSKTITFDVIEI